MLAGAKSVWDWLCDGVSTIAKNAVKAAQEIYNDPLSGVSNLANGFANTITCGLTGRIQHWVGNDIYVDKKSAAYSTGEVAGTAVEIGLGVGNPCTAAGWASTGLKALNAAEFVGNSLNLGEHLGSGDYLAAAGDVVGMMNNVSQMRRSCFAAGTPILTPDGYKNIEEIRVGDLVLSAPEDDPEGEVVPRVVEEVFVRTSPVLSLAVGVDIRSKGKTPDAAALEVLGMEVYDLGDGFIRTTTEHPFYVRGKGWTKAWLLCDGDEFRSHDGQSIPLDYMCGTEKEETVYNLRVADYHTYFVGKPEWGFSVWAHNASCDARELASDLEKKFRPRSLGEQAAHAVPTGVFSGRKPLVQQAVKGMQAILKRAKIGINSAKNGFWAKAGHRGTHTNDFLIDLYKSLAKAEGKGKVAETLESIVDKLRNVR